MAGQNNNKVVEFEFRGNTLNLEQAINKIGSLLRGSATTAKQIENAKTKYSYEQNRAETLNYLASLKEQRDANKTLSKEETEELVRKGNKALRLAEEVKKTTIATKQQIANKEEKLSNQSIARAEKEAARKEAIIQKTSAKNIAVAASRMNFVSTPLLERYSQQLQTLPGGNELIGQLEALTASFYKEYSIFQETGKNGEQLAATIDQLSAAHNSAREIVANFTKTIEAQQKSIVSWDALLISATQRAKDYFTNINTYIRAVRKTLRGIWSTVKTSTSLYADYVESVDLIRTTTANATEDLEDFATAMSMKYGYSLKNMNDMIASYYSFADALGMTASQATLLSKKMSQLTLDWASLRNMTTEEASKKLQAALAGRTQAMNFYGAVVSDANVEEWLLNKGIKKNFSAMNEASQASARFAYLLDALKSSEGDLERTLDSTANQLRILNDQTDQLKTNLGSLFNRVLSPGIRLLNNILQPVNKFLAGYNAIEKESKNVTEDATDQINAQTEAYEELESVGLTSLDEINQAQTTDSTAVDSDIANLLDDIADVSVDVNDSMYKAGETLGNFFDKMPDWLRTTLDLILALGGIAAALAIVIGAYKLFGSIASKSLATVLAKTLEHMSATSANTAATEAGTIATEQNATAATQEAAAVGTSAETKVADAAANTAEATSGGTNAAVKEVVAGAAAGEKTAIMSEQPAKRADAASNIQEASTGAAAGAGKVAAAGIGAPAVAALIMSGLGLVAGVAGLIVALSSKTKSGMQVPAMATGGVVDTATLAMIGEGKYQEAVVPLGKSPQFAEMKNDIASAVLEKISHSPFLSQPGGANANRPIVLNLNGREFARAIIPDLSAVQPQTGVKIQR